MHTFDDWELRQLLEDTLTEARHTYQELRAQQKMARVGPWKSSEAKANDWQAAVRRAIEVTMAARWHDSTRPAVKESPCP